MGKVKLLRRINYVDNSFVSIPYGKGKVGMIGVQLVKLMYQFPMGKVKQEALGKKCMPVAVSIPYGKGKENSIV